MAARICSVGLVTVSERRSITDKSLDEPQSASLPGVSARSSAKQPPTGWPASRSVSVGITRSGPRKRAALESQWHVRLYWVGSLDPGPGQALGNKEGQLQRLVAVQSRIAQGLVAAHQVCLDQVISATDTLGDVV